MWGGTTNSGTLQFNGVNATTAGNYSLTIHYLSGAASWAQLSVNGGAATLTLPSTGSWNTVGLYQMTVSLNAGSSNFVKLSNTSGWAPDIDRVTVY